MIPVTDIREKQQDFYPGETTDMALFVRTSEEAMVGWDRHRIVDALMRETYIDPDTAEAISGLPLKKLCFEGPEEELARTDLCQPAIFTVSASG